MIGLAAHVGNQVGLDHKMLGLTEALSTDSTVVGLVVYVVDQVHS